MVHNETSTEILLVKCNSHKNKNIYAVINIILNNSMLLVIADIKKLNMAN